VFFRRTITRKIRIIGWHGNNATGDDLLGHCVKNIFQERASKKGIKAEVTDSDDCDLAVIGGGTILGVDSMGLHRIVKNIRAPLIIFGGGFRRERRDIGDQNRTRMRRLFKRAKLTGVRGYISQQFFIHNEIDVPEVIGDPGMLFKPERVRRSFDGKHKVGVFLRNMGKTGEPQYIENVRVHQMIAKICDWLCEEFKSRLYFFSFAENRFDSDLEGIRSALSFMINKNSAEIIPYSSDFIQKCSMVGEMDYVVSQRLHPVVLAWSREIPCVGIDYQFGKTADFMGSIGMDEFTIRTDEFTIDIYKIKVKRLMAEKKLILEQSQRSISHWQKKLADFTDRSLDLIAR
jgi:polysaccharide pyruvyl transferase WcaK-like protein